MPRPLPPEALRAVADPRRFPFATTADLAPLEGVIGQERAARAVEFGMGMRVAGYNMFVVGPPATGKASTMRAVATRLAREEKTPPDRCYVVDFDDAYRPRLLTLPAGRGRQLRDGMVRVVDEVKVRMARTFESEDFSRKSTEAVADMERRSQATIKQVEEAAKRFGFTVRPSETGFDVVFAPEGRALTGEELDELEPEARAHMEAQARALDADMEPLLRQMRQLGREAEQARARVVEECATHVVRAVLADLRAAVADVPAVGAFLDGVEKDLVAHAAAFIEPDEEEDDEEQTPTVATPPGNGGRFGFLDRYRINVFVDRAGEKGAPVVREVNPTYTNLFGRIERRVELGALVTDHTLLRPGALQRADGGYLLLEVRDVVAEPHAWTALKRTLRAGQVRIEEPTEEMRMVAAGGLEPEPMPLDLKVILMGTPEIYELLWEMDDDFRELFKVKVDFDDSLPRTDETELRLARFVAGVCHDSSLPHFDAAAVARLVEEGSRAVAHQRRMSARLGDLVRLVRESAFVATRAGRTLVGADDVKRAVADARERKNLVEEQLARATDEGEILISTSGSAVGQVNGLEVLSIADHTFGRPMRLTARVRPGKVGVIDVERRTGLGGRIHSKGVLILGGFLAGRYAIERPLAMAATLVAEQSYGPVDGDSASVAELCALLSALAEVPLVQSLAITGSVNQAGEAQAVGGTIEKIEGFFDLCRRRGLTGREGVLVPTAVVHQLMLHDDVVEATRARRFQVIAYATVDEAIELLAGRRAGERGPDGHFAEGSINRLVEERLRLFARAVLRPRRADG